MAHDTIQWRCHTRLEKRHGDWTAAEIDAGIAPAPYEIREIEGNLLMTAGANALWTALTGGAITAFSNANARIGVGDSTTAAAAGQTDLQAATNKLRKGMDTGYPAVTNNAVDFRASFGSAEANFAWNEWSIFNAGTGGVMLNRKVESLGTKASGSTWTLTVTLSLA